MIIQFIRLKSNLPQDELLRRANERKPRFEETPGLLQKYYVKLADEGAYGGIYVWDSPESMKKFRETELFASIPGAYEITGPPDVEMLQVLFQLRD